MTFDALVLDLVAKRAVLVAPFRLASVRRKVVRVMDSGAELSLMALVAPGLLMAFFAFNRRECRVPAVFLFKETDRFVRCRFDEGKIAVTEAAVMARLFVIVTSEAIFHCRFVLYGDRTNDVFQPLMAGCAFGSTAKVRFMGKIRAGAHSGKRFCLCKICVAHLAVFCVERLLMARGAIGHFRQKRLAASGVIGSCFVAISAYCAGVFDVLLVGENDRIGAIARAEAVHGRTEGDDQKGDYRCSMVLFHCAVNCENLIWVVNRTRVSDEYS